MQYAGDALALRQGSYSVTVTHYMTALAKMQGFFGPEGEKMNSGGFHPSFLRNAKDRPEVGTITNKGENGDKTVDGQGITGRKSRDRRKLRPRGNDWELCRNRRDRLQNHRWARISSPIFLHPTSLSGSPAMSAVCQPSPRTLSTAFSMASASALSWKE